MNTWTLRLSEDQGRKKIPNATALTLKTFGIWRHSDIVPVVLMFGFVFYLERDACSAHQLELDQKKKIKKSFLAPQLTTNPVLLRSVEQRVFRAKHFQRERVHALIWDTAGPIAMHEHGRPDCCERPKSLFMACSFSLCSTMGVRVFRHPGSCVCSCLKINKIKLARGEA